MWQGACVAGGHAWQGEGACVSGETATAVDGTHPTGMHSCSWIIFSLLLDLFRFRSRFRLLCIGLLPV